MPTPHQMEFPFASLDFPGRTSLTIPEVAERLGLSKHTIHRLIEQEEIASLAVGASRQHRTHVRIPVEAYRDYVVKNISGPHRTSFLRALPPKTLRQLIADCEFCLSLIAQS
ncbi:MAG: helix-turn-helix domain-containing protein [Opitutales bacterium]|nr:helix-turn-helix domain-containing protein [Opitutales bacterium]